MAKVNNIIEYLNSNSYQGRGIILGCTKNDKSFLAYFIMGRSENSRNRYFLKDGGDIYAKVKDETKAENIELISYRATASIKKDSKRSTLIVSNGDQTDTIYTFLQNNSTFNAAIEERTYEPDSPIFTPRISGCVDFEDSSFCYKLSIIKKNYYKTYPIRIVYNYQKNSGYGHLIHTYSKSSDGILSSFSTSPVLINIDDDFNAFSNSIWENLNADNKISLYTRLTDAKTMEIEERIFNKY